MWWATVLYTSICIWFVFSGFWNCDIFNLSLWVRTPLPLCNPQYLDRKPAATWFRFPGLSLWMWKGCIWRIRLEECSHTSAIARLIILYNVHDHVAQIGSFFSHDPTWLPNPLWNTVFTCTEKVFWRKTLYLQCIYIQVTFFMCCIVLVAYLFYNLKNKKTH